MNPDSPIFVCGRFRAGTSFLWQLFDRLPGFCAWYEPLHPQLPAHVDHVKPKADHVGIDDYWRSYKKHPAFTKHFSPDFAHNGLWLESDSQYPELKAYIDDLIDASGDQRAVLQFNRMDFRLPWLKTQFPEATLIHIRRNPLQLWHSQRKHLPMSEKDNPSATDAYELMQWSVALSHLFPFLAKRNHVHAFYRCYLIQRMSDWMADHHADVCLTLEQDVFESQAFAQKLAQGLGVSEAEWLAAQSDPHVSMLHDFDEAELAPLLAIMTEADGLLAASGLAKHCGQMPLSEIKAQHPEFWQSQQLSAEWHNEEMLHALAAQQTELTRLLAEKNKLLATAQKNDEQTETN